jgi:hypothetical protein
VVALTNVEEYGEIPDSFTSAFDASLSRAVFFGSTGVAQAFYLDLQSNTASLINQNFGSKTGVAAVTPDGRYVALGEEFWVVLWDAQLQALVYSNFVFNIFSATNSGATSIAVSLDGNRLAYVTNGVLFGVDRGAKTNLKLASSVSGGRDVLQFSGDSRYLVYVTSEPLARNDTNNANDVYRYDFQAKTNLLISQNGAGVVGNGPSDWPALSPNGRFIAYRSAASNLTSNGAGAYPQIYLYDSLSNLTSLISTSVVTGAGGNNRSLAPVFSGDSTTLVFGTWASDLVTNDFSGSGGIDAVTVAVYPPALVGAIRISPGGFPIVSFPAVAGTAYQVQYKNNLADPSWQPLPGTITTVSNTAAITDSARGPQRFYRVQSN